MEPLQCGKNHRYPSAIWLAFILSIAIHAMLLVDISFHRLSGNPAVLPGLRLRLELDEPRKHHSIGKHSQQSPKQQRQHSDNPEARQSPTEAAVKPPITQRQAASAKAGETGRKGKLSDKRTRYIEALLRRIEAHKYYPQRAKHRGMEGTVHVAFTLYGSNDIRNVEISGASQMFNTVARQALKNSTPFAAPPKDVELPMNVEYVMAFRLK